MANVDVAETAIAAFPYPATVLTWTPLTSANPNGTAVVRPQLRDKSVQFTGTFDSATVTLTGSNDGTNYKILTDPLGNTLSFTDVAGPTQISEITAYIRPASSGGGGSQSITCIIVGTNNKV